MIFVFKTSVATRNDVEQLRPHLDKLPHSKWNFDLEDCDNILRIDSEQHVSKTIIRVLRAHGFGCEELTD